MSRHGSSVSARGRRDRSGCGVVRRSPDVLRQPPFERQCGPRTGEVDARGRGPEGERRMLQHEAAGSGADDPAHLPREARKREIPSDERGGARSTPSGAWIAPCRHSPSAKTSIAPASVAAATVVVVHTPAAHTIMSDTAQTTPIAASPRIRRRLSMSFATGSWKMTMPIASSAKITPTSRSFTCVTFFAERRQQLDHQRDRGRHERRVQGGRTRGTCDHARPHARAACALRMEVRRAHAQRARGMYAT